MVKAGHKEGIDTVLFRGVWVMLILTTHFSPAEPFSFPGCFPYPAQSLGTGMLLSLRSSRNAILEGKGGTTSSQPTAPENVSSITLVLADAPDAQPNLTLLCFNVVVDLFGTVTKKMLD